METLHNFLFIALPYTAAAVFLVGTMIRFKTAGFKVSSLSSQFLEGEKLFWGSVPFHAGMLGVFLLHLAAFLIPKSLLLWNSHPVRLIVLEITGFVFALSFLFGLVVLLIRRMTHPRIRVVTTPMDIAVELLLLYQILLGCGIAVSYRWGSSWFASDLSPYLWSLLVFNPQIDAVKAMKPMIQLHIAGAYLILLIFPFTRLVHMLAVPIHYLFRPYQQVIWNVNRKTVRNAESEWNRHTPKNN